MTAALLPANPFRWSLRWATDVRTAADGTEQREALVLSQVGGMTGQQAAEVLGCTPARVRALIYQAREALLADRTARALPCSQVREQVAQARGPLNRHLRRHLEVCDRCTAERAPGGRRTAAGRNGFGRTRWRLLSEDGGLFCKTLFFMGMSGCAGRLSGLRVVCHGRRAGRKGLRAGYGLPCISGSPCATFRHRVDDW